MEWESEDIETKFQILEEIWSGTMKLIFLNSPILLSYQDSNQRSKFYYKSIILNIYLEWFKIITLLHKNSKYFKASDCLYDNKA